MLVINHTLSSAIIAVTIPPPFVPIVAFILHFILDTFPHSDGSEPPLPRAIKTQIAIDLALSPLVYAFCIWLFPDQWLIITIGVFFGILPDALWIFWKKGGPKWFQRFLDWAHYIQWGERPYGWILDGIYALLFAVALYLLSV